MYPRTLPELVETTATFSPVTKGSVAAFCAMSAKGVNAMKNMATIIRFIGWVSLC